VLLTYRDPSIAEEEARRLRSGNAKRSDDGVILNLSTRLSLVIIKNKTVILIRDSSAKQKDVIAQIAADIEKL